MNNDTVISLNFTRTVYAHELRPGDVFILPNAPSTPLTVIERRHLTVSTEITLVSLTLPGLPKPLHLPPNTPVRPNRMVRTAALDCLICSNEVDIELDLPRDGEPLSVICGKHTLDSDSEDTQR